MAVPVRRVVRVSDSVTPDRPGTNVAVRRCRRLLLWDAPGSLTLASTVPRVRPSVFRERPCPRLGGAVSSRNCNPHVSPKGQTLMLVTDYDLAKLRFAYCHHAYLRLSTHARHP